MVVCIYYHAILDKKIIKDIIMPSITIIIFRNGIANPIKIQSHFKIEISSGIYATYLEVSIGFIPV